MAIGSDQSLECALELAELSGRFATGCLETGAPSEAALTRAAKYLRIMGIELVCSAELDPIEVCATRLKELGEESAIPSESFNSERAVFTAVSWREFQLAVMDHDVCFTPHFSQLSTRDQFIQRTLEIAKLGGEMTQSLGDLEMPPSDELRRQLADIVILGIRLATAAGEVLPDYEDVPRTMREHSVALMGEEILEEYEEQEEKEREEEEQEEGQ